MTTTVIEYLGGNGASPFAHWFDGLDAQAAARVTTAVTRVQLGNMSNTKGVGEGVFEYRIHSGAGIRIYFGKDGDTLVILLGGGTKRRQQKDIDAAKDRWRQYKQHKRRNQAWH